VEQDARRDLANLSALTQEHALRTLRAADQALQLVRALALRDGAQLDLGRWVRSGAIDVQMYHQVGVIDAQGIYRFSNLPQTPPVDLSDREHFRVHVHGSGDVVFVSRPVLGRVSKKWTLQLTRRIEQAGRFAGVAVVSLDADYFSGFYSGLQLGQFGSVTLLGTDAVVRARHPDVAGSVGRELTKSDTLAQLGKGQQHGEFETLSPIDHELRLYHFRRIAGYPLVVLVGFGVNEYRAATQHAARMDWIGTAVAGTLALALAALFSWHRVREQRQNAQLLSSQQKSSLALESGGLGVWEWDLHTRLIRADARLCALLGVAAEEPVSPDMFLQRLHPDDLLVLHELLPAVLRGQQERLIFEHRIRHGTGHWVWLIARGQVVERDAQGRALRMLGTDADVTQQRQALEAARVAAVAFRSSSPMMICAADQTILSVNPAFEALSDYSAQGCVGRRGNLLKSGRQNAAFYQAMWAALTGPDGHWEGEVLNRRKNGEVFPDWLSITAVRDEHDQITHYVAVHADITLRKRSEEEIRKLAFFDPLTGLANRRLLLDRLQQMRATLARLGGDEFVVALAQLGADQNAAQASALGVAEKIRDAIGQPFDLTGLRWQPTLSIGVALLLDAQEPVQDWLKRADAAMYAAKAAGRNNVQLHCSDRRD